MKKMMLIIVMVVALTSAGQAGLLTWTGAVNNSTFNEANWDLDSYGPPPAGTIDGDTPVQHDMLVNSPTATLGGLHGAGAALVIGSGSTLTITDGILKQNVTSLPKGINGVRDLNPSYINITGGTIITQFITKEVNVTLGGDGLLEIYGATSISDDVTIDFTSTESQLHMINQSLTQFTTSHLDSIMVNGSAAVIGENISVITDGASGLYVTAIPEAAPLIVSPANGSYLLTNSALPLQWSNIDPNTATQTTVDVMIGTEPNGADFTLLDSGAISSTTFNASVTGTYYWQVNSYIESGSTVADANGFIWSFTVVTDIPPTVDITTNNKMTWSGEAVSLTTIVTDDNTHTITWDAVSDVVTDVITIDTTTNGIELPIITIDKAELLGAVSHVTVTVTVDDGLNDPVSDIAAIDVYDTACLLARQGLGLSGAYDGNFDCVTDILDFAGMAQEWLVDYAADGPVDK